MNRCRCWWVNVHVMATFWCLLSGFQSVSVSLTIPGVHMKTTEIAALRPATIAAAQGDKDEPGTNNALQAVRSVMSMFNLITGTVVGSDGYRVQCRHAGQSVHRFVGAAFRLHNSEPGRHEERYFAPCPG